MDPSTSSEPTVITIGPLQLCRRFSSALVKELKPGHRHACPRCDSTFTRPANRDHHVRVVHEKRKQHACPHCAVVFARLGDQTKHVQTVHEKRRDHACPHCTAAFGTSCTLTKHVRAKHEKRR
jgi:uncharacterized C2H2 Zn-finger protein